MRNMFDPLHHDTLEDDEYSVRVRYFDQHSMWRPLRSVKGMMSYTWTGGQPNLSAAMDDYYAGDRDFGYVQAHGWAQGAAQFSAYRFATASGLTLFNGGSGPCETGYPDYHVNSGNKKVLQYNVGDAAVTNPDGGALASVNNSRWSWAGGGGGFAAMSYYMLNEMLVGFNQERKNVGDAWLKGVRNYWPAGKNGGTAGWVLTEQFLYGDPLVQLPEVPNVWWQGGETGVWDRVTSVWSNNVDRTTTFDAAYNVYFDVRTNLDVDVAGEIAAMRLSIPVWQEDAVLTLAGTGSLRVMQCIDVAGTNTTLRFDVEGGVGHSGIQFLTGAGDLVFTGMNRFYVGGVKNARRVSLLGGGVTLDVDEFPSGSFPLVIDGGLGAARPTVPNVLRSKKAGGLVRFGSFAITNSYLKLSTVDAFGNGAPMTHELVDSELEIGANVYYQRNGFPEGLNATFLVDGVSAVMSSEGGLWTVKHTTTFALRPETYLALDAATVNAGGRIVITNIPSSTPNPQPSTLNPNVVEVFHGDALSGDVTVGEGIRLALHELPLTSVSSLAIGKGATVELPDDPSGYWQIVPVSSSFDCAGDVTFVTAANPSTPLEGSSSRTGSFFREGALYRWTGLEGEWNTFFANRHPKILFGDLPANDVTVRVASAVSPEFAFFSNLRTKYVFAPSDDEAFVFFTSVYFCGPTEFDVPLGAGEYVEVSTGTSRFFNVTAPYVHVASGAGLALAGSHWTEFRLDAGSLLVALPDEALDWNADTTLALPAVGEVLVDVGALALSDAPSMLVGGYGHDWTISDLANFRLVQTNAEFRIFDNELYVVRGDGLKGPYELAFNGLTNWNTLAWTAASNAFPKTWGDCALDWSSEVVVDVRTKDEGQPAKAQLALDCDVHANLLTILAGTNDFTLATNNQQPVFEVSTLDLTDCHGVTEIGVDTGNATILTASSTNGADIVHLRGAGSGAIELAGVTLVMDHPGDFTLKRGAQGTLKVVASQAYERFRIAKVPADFENSGLAVVVTDGEGRTLSGFKTSVADGALWCVPPALEAEVPPGTNDFTRLAWRDILGNVVSNVSWASSAGFKLIGTETSGVVIAKSGFESVWSRLSVSNEVTFYGNDSFAIASVPGPGTLTLAGAFTLRANVNVQTPFLSGAHLKLLDESTLEISHGRSSFNASAQDWSGITGTGRIRFTDDTGSYLAVPGRLFANTLRVETSSDIVLTGDVSAANPFAVRDLSGSGSFRSDWQEVFNVRPVRTVQTGVSVYSGYLRDPSRNRDSKLVVSSDGPVATLDKALVLDGTTKCTRQIEIETNGCVYLTGNWKGPIKVAGILVITTPAATNGLNVTILPGGVIREVAAEEVPAATSASAYVPPTYPEDPEPSDVPVVDSRVRILTAVVGGRAALPAWTGLDWRNTNGDSVASIDWSFVTNVTIVATNGAVRVLFDAEAFTGVVRLVGDTTVEVRKLKPFVLDAASAGAVDFRLLPVPTSTCDLLYVTEPSTSNLQPSTSVTIHDRYGREIDVAGEVTFDAAKRKYYLNVQNVGRPNYNCTFDAQYEDSLTSPLWFSGSGNLTYKARPEFFEDSRSGRALKGSCMYHFAMHSHNGNPTIVMDDVGAWALNFVAKLPTNNGGIIFGWGNKDSGNGVAFARVSENVAGVYAWEKGGAPNLVASANVPFASRQFHSYAITHDSHTLCFYVDGVLAEAVSLEDKYPTRGFYQWFKMYGQNGRLQDGSTSVVDDFRLYLYALTPASVRAIAKDFPPWPEVPSASVDCAGIGWNDLYWTAEAAPDEAVEITGDGGSFVLDEPVEIANPLTITGEPVPVKVTGEGVLVAAGGISVTATSGLTFDCSNLDGTNFAARAVTGVPYARWVLRGAYSGPVSVTALPLVPDGYEVRVEYFSRVGVRLVFVAPRYAFADSVGISVGGDTFTDLTGDVGLHPTSPTNWFPYADWTTTPTLVGGLSVTGTPDGKVDSQRPYGDDTSVPRYFRSTSFDGNSDDYNGKTNGLFLAGLSTRFDRYRVLVYLATDTVGAYFGPVTIDGRTYCGVNAGDETSWATVADSTSLAWGKSRFTTASEGVNVVISDVLTNDAVVVSAQRLKSGGKYARAQIAAVQIVRVGEVHLFSGTHYAAEVVADTDWADGAGTGLVCNAEWRNDPYSTITLTAAVAQATLTFNTAVTAETLRVVSAADRTLVLRRGACDVNIYSYDLSASEGAVTFADGLGLAGAELERGAKGAIGFIVDNVTTNQRLMKLAADFDYAADFTASVRDREGKTPPESWTVLPLGGWLVLQLRDVDKPWYSLTFEGALDATVTQAVSLVSEGSPRYVPSRDGQAMTGGTPYTSPAMESVPDAWTIHAVAQMPKETQGILFGYGRLGERGVGLATVDADTVAVAWWDNRGRATVINAEVPQATCQFHAYALVSTGAGVSLYVDGVFKGYAAVSVNPSSAVLQIGSIQGGIVNGFVKTETGAIDDWRLYDGVLSTNAIATLARQFAPWPDYRTAELTEAETAWDDLVWAGGTDADCPYLIEGRGGSLVLTNACELTNALFSSGSALVLHLKDDGQLVSDAGLSFLSGWTIDCTGLDGTNFLERAAVGNPYVRWLVRGAYAGGDPTVTGLPDESARHSVTVHADPSLGVWLVVTIRADYVANLTNTTTWADGMGAGLEVVSSAWVNDATSTITLTQRTDVAMLEFDTAVTARLVKVVSLEGQTLTLWNGSAAVAIAGYDFSEARGVVVLSNDVSSGTTLALGRMTVFGGAMEGMVSSAPAGATMRYEKSDLTVTAARLTSGVTNSFASATLNGDLYNHPRTYLVRAGDDVTICPSGGGGLNHQFNGRIVVEGGRLLLDSSNAYDRFWYGICGAASFRQTGGETVANAHSEVTDGNGCFLFGVSSGSGGTIPVDILGGTFTVADSPLCFWLDIPMTIGGTGVVKVKGLWGNKTKGRLSLDAGGVLSVGAKGVAANLHSFTLNGGLLTAHADARTEMTIALSSDSTIAADNGVTHTVSGAITGSGKITIGTTNRTGTVVLTDASAFNHDLEIVSGVLDIGTYRPNAALKRTGGRIRVRLTDAEVAERATIQILPIGMSDTNSDFIVLSPAGGALEPEWVAVSDGYLTVDTAQLDFSRFVQPFHGTMRSGKTWADQEWYDSFVPSNRIPSVYWASAANVTAVIDIETNAVVESVPAGVTNLTVRGEGTIVSEGKWPDFKGLTDAAWRGTVRIRNMTDCTGTAGCTFDGLGNANSTVEMDGVVGWFNGLENLGAKWLGKSHAYTLKIGAGGFTMNNGNSGQGYSFVRLTGSGVFAVGKDGPTFRVVALEAESFTGRIAVTGNAAVTLGTPARNPSDGTIVVASDARVSVDPSLPWSAPNGFVFDAGSTLNLRADGTADSYTVVTGESLALPSDAHLTFGGGEDERADWFVDGGTLRRIEAWTEDLRIDAEYARQVIRVAQPLTLVLTNVGGVTVARELDASAAKLSIDASGLAVTNFVRYAVAGAPYSHWIVKGPVRGTIEVSKLPVMPPTYSVAAEVVPTHGVRLVVAANRAARFGSVNLNFAGGRDGNWNNSAAHLSDDAVATKEHGAHPIIGSDWHDLSCQAGTYAVGGVTVSVSGVNNPYTTGRAASPRLLFGYADDSKSPLVTISGIPFAKYRVIVYRSTDSANLTYSAVKIGTVAADAVYCNGPTAGDATGGATLFGATQVVWGDSDVNEVREGVTYVVSDVLTGTPGSATAYVYSQKHGDSRACVAAIQVVKVGEIYDGPPEYEERLLANKLSFRLPGTTTTQTYDYVYHPQGADDGKWETVSNWATAEIWQRKSGAIETNYTALSGAKAPALADSGMFVPVVVDGHAVTGTTVEGWLAQYGLCNGADVTITTLKKIQGNGSKFIAVDATSRLTIVNAISQDNSDYSVNYHVAAPSGIVYRTAFANARNLTVNYYLEGEGSVSYENGFSTGTHVLKHATVELGDARWTSRTVRKKYLIIGSGSVTRDNVSVPGDVTHQANDAEVSAADAVGTYRFGSDGTGTFVEWVARTMPEIYEVHPSETGVELPMDETSRVKIVCFVTNELKEVKVDLTAAFRLEKSKGGVRATLDPTGIVEVPAIGSAAAEMISVVPELDMVEGDEHVSTVPFAVTEGAAAVGVKTIPGLTYKLMRGSDLTTFDHEADVRRATSSRIKLRDANKPSDKAFYLIRVER